ncbi:MAG: FAD-dependent monooxygenase [Solirubrobacterales bacterium]|nr:FAD-dependent monooxygenase [Solirubrobacterales bacterium]
MCSQRQVFVVGAGPAGLVLAITLAAYGVDVLVLEKRARNSNLSRALVISTRSMEIFRAWGLEERIRAGAADVKPYLWRTRALASSEGTEFALGYPTAAEAAEISPTGPAWAPQDHLEPLLLELLRSLPNAEVRFGCDVVDLNQRGERVRAVVQSANDPSTTDELHAGFAVGADGTHSVVRDALGIPLHGPDDLGEFHRVEFLAPLEDVVGDRRYGLYGISNPEVGGVVAPRGRSGRWGLSREGTPGRPRLVDMSEDELVELIETAAGVRRLHPELERSNAFRFAAQIAERYRDGRVFLVGDAAHRMTPRGGTGMNTAIQDAYDLGWKLAWVLRGWSGAALLDSYEVERRPVGVHNVERAQQSDGARRDAADALPWDLYGRVRHSWTRHAARTVSTLDLLGKGWTALVGPTDRRWHGARVVDSCAPLVVHQLQGDAAAALGIDPGGALLLRPDGKEAGRWACFTPALIPAAPTSLVVDSPRTEGSPRPCPSPIPSPRRGRPLRRVDVDTPFAPRPHSPD